MRVNYYLTISKFTQYQSLDLNSSIYNLIFTCMLPNFHGHERRTQNGFMAVKVLTQINMVLFHFSCIRKDYSLISVWAITFSVFVVISKNSWNSKLNRNPRSPQTITQNGFYSNRCSPSILITGGFCRKLSSHLVAFWYKYCKQR